MSPMFRFIYSNMDYHGEHHIFLTVPYHALRLMSRLDVRALEGCGS